MDKNMLLIGRLCESAYPAVSSGALPRSVSYPHEMAESTAQDLAYDEDFLQPFEPLSYHSGGRAIHSGLDSAVSNLDLFAQLELAHLDPVRATSQFSSAAAAAAAACLANSSLSEQMSRSDSCLAAAAAAAADAEEAGVGNPLFEPEDSARTDAGVGGAGAGSLLLGNSVAGMTTSVSQSSANVKQILGKSASPNYQVVVGMDASVAMSGASAGSNMSTWMALAKSNKRFVSTSDLEASDDATADDSRLPAAAATSAGSGRPPMTTWSAVRTSSIKDVSAAASPGVANGNNNAPGAPPPPTSAGSAGSGGDSAWRQLKSAGGGHLVSWKELNRIVRDARPLDSDQKSRHEMSSSTAQQNAVAWRKQQQQPQQQQQQQQQQRLQQQLTPEQQQQVRQQQQQVRQQQQQNRYSGTLLELFKRATNTPASASPSGAPPEPAPQQQQQPQPESTLRFLHGGGPGFREFRRRARELVDQQQQFPASAAAAGSAARRTAGRPVGVGRSHSDLQHGRRYIAAQQQQQLPSLAFLRDSLPLGDPSSVVAAAAAASASSATTTADAAGDSGIGTAVGDGSVSASAASNFVCRNCGHPQHQQQLARRLAGGKQKRSQSLDTTAASAAAAAAAAADEAEAAESKSAERLRRAARRRVARATDSSRKQRGGLGGSGAKRTLSEPHRLCSVSSATAAGGTAANSGSGAGASGSGVGYDMTQSLTDSQEEESSAAAAATPHRSTTPQAASSSARRDYPDDSDDGGGGGGFRAKKSVSFCDRIQFHSPKGQAAASPTAGSAAAGQIWRGGVGSTVDLGAAAAVLPSGDSPHRQQTLLRRPLSLQLNYDVQVIPQQVGLYGDNDSPPLVFCGSPVGSPRRTAESTAAASQQQRQSRLDRLSQLVSDAIRGVNDLILAATASPLAAGTADASNQQRLSSVLSQSLCPPLHGLLTDELLSSGGSGGSGPGSRLSFGRSRSQLWQLIEETCKPSGQPASRRLNEVLRQVRSVGGLSTERLKFNAFVAACLNSKQLSAWFHHAASSESILKRYYKPGAFLRSAQTVHCELFADLSTSLELLNSHSFGIELAVSASSSVTAAGQNNSRSKPAGQQPLKARHDIKTQQPPPPPPPPPQHQRPAAPAPPPRVQSRLPRPTSSADSATASSSVSIGSSVSSTASSTAAGVKTKSASSGGSGGGLRSTLSGLMRRPGSSSSSKQQQPGTGKR